MVDTLPNLQAVYSKWEGNNPFSRDGAPSNYGNRAPPSLKPTQMSSGEYGKMLSSGREAWRNQYSAHSSALPVRRHKGGRNSRGPNSLSVLSMSEVMSNNLAHFKTNPSVDPATNSRPFTGRCCTCMPNSRNAFYNEEYRDSGFKDILQLDTASEDNGFLTRTFCVCAHVFSKRCIFKYPDVALNVLTSPRLIEAINKTVEENTADVDKDSPSLMEILKKQQKKVQARAKRVINRMKAVMSSHLIRFTAWFLHKLLGRLLSSIVVHKGQMKMVKQACQKDLPVIFLPTHRSHLDYILITFILSNHGIMAPHVAAGDNLLIPFFGPLMRGLGGYFIRRKLDKYGRKDHVYRAVLHQYMCELLQRNQNFEFFVEGGRTRSGKAIYPKGGLLSVIVDAFNDGIISDAYIVPISISYDRILDGNFCREQMGEPKLRETFWRACQALWTVIMSRYGNVRVDFTQPFSLKESIQVSPCGRKPLMNSFGGEPSPGCDSPLTPDGIIKMSPSEGSIYGTEVAEDQRQLIQGLAEHIVHEQNCNTAAMSTHMVALLLLTKHRQGVHISTLIEDFDWLKQEVLNRGRDLGFSGKTPDVLSHALSVLGDRLAKEEPVDSNEKDVSSEKNKLAQNNNNAIENVFIRPTVSLPDVFELSYYANITNSVFIVESSLANALFALVERDDWTSLTKDTIFVSRQHLLVLAETICRFLKYEYIFTPPCVPLEQTLVEGFERLTCAEILQIPNDNEGCEDSRERDWAQRLNKSLSFGAEEEDSDDTEWSPPDVLYQVNHQDAYCMAKLTFLRQIVAPILETYYITACNLISLLTQDMPEDDFVQRTHKQLKDRVLSGVAGYAESASLDTLKNGLRSFQHNKVITCYQAANIRMIGLVKSYRTEDAVQAFVQQFESYRE